MPPPSREDFLAHADFLERLARRLVRDESAAQDLVQQTWVAALERPPREHAAVRAWLRTVARRLARKLRREEVPGDGEASTPAGADPAAELARTEVLARVAAEVDALPEPYRDVVLLRYWENLPPRAIAARLGRPVNTVNRQLARAATKLRERLDAEWHGDRDAWCGALVVALVARRELARSAGLGAPALTVVTLLLVLSATWMLRERPATEHPAPADEAVAVSTPAPPSAPPTVGDARAEEPVRAESEEPAGEPAMAAAGGAEPAPPPPPDRVLEVVTPEGVLLADASLRVPLIDRDPTSGVLQNDSAYSIEAGFVEIGRTDASGRAEVRWPDVELASPNPDAVDVFVAYPGRAHSLFWSVPRTGDEVVRLRAGGVAHALSGRVVGPDGIGLERATVVLKPTSVGRAHVDAATGTPGKRPVFTMRTGADGRFSFAELEGELYTVMVLASGHDRFSESVRAGEAGDHTFSLRRTPTISGVVLQGGRQVPGASVLVQTRLSSFEAAPADAGGRYLCGGIPLHRWVNLKVVHPSRPELVAETLVRLEPGKDVVWDAILEEAPGVTVKIVDESGAPRPGLFVEVRDDDGFRSKLLPTDDEGLLRHHETGTRSVSVYVLRTPRDPLALQSVHGVELSAPPRTLVVTVPRQEPATGTLSVRMPDGTIPPGVAANLRDARGNYVSLGFERDTGSVSFDVPANTYEILLCCEGIGAARLFQDHLRPGRQELGPVTLSEPGRLEVECDLPADPRRQLEVEVMVQRAGGVYDGWGPRIHHGQTPTARGFDLLPWAYRVVVLRDGRIERYAFATVRARHTTVVRIGAERTVPVWLWADRPLDPGGMHPVRVRLVSAADPDEAEERTALLLPFDIEGPNAWINLPPGRYIVHATSEGLAGRTHTTALTLTGAEPFVEHLVNAP